MLAILRNTLLNYIFLDMKIIGLKPKGNYFMNIKNLIIDYYLHTIIIKRL